DVGKHEILWEIPTSEIQCISTNELNYTKEQNHFSIPVNKIDFDKESLIFTWNISEEYKPIISVKKEDFWFQLKTAESLLTAIKYFQDNNELYTIYDQANFYVDRNFA